MVRDLGGKIASQSFGFDKEDSIAFGFSDNEEEDEEVPKKVAQNQDQTFNKLLSANLAPSFKSASHVEVKQAPKAEPSHSFKNFLPQGTSSPYRSSNEVFDSLQQNNRQFVQSQNVSNSSAQCKVEQRLTPRQSDMPNLIDNPPAVVKIIENKVDKPPVVENILQKVVVLEKKVEKLSSDEQSIDDPESDYSDRELQKSPTAQKTAPMPVIKTSTVTELAQQVLPLPIQKTETEQSKSPTIKADTAVEENDDLDFQLYLSENSDEEENVRQEKKVEPHKIEPVAEKTVEQIQPAPVTVPSPSSKLVKQNLTKVSPVQEQVFAQPSPPKNIKSPVYSNANRVVPSVSPAKSPVKQVLTPEKPAKSPVKQVLLPEKQAKSPEKPAKLPEKQAKLPEKQAKAPENQTKIPEKQVKLLKTQAKSPEKPGNLPVPHLVNNLFSPTLSSSESSEVEVHKCQACGDEFRTVTTLKIHRTQCEKIPAKVVPEKVVAPATTVPEKFAVQDTIVPEKFVVEAKIVPDNVVVPVKMVTEKFNAPPKIVPEMVVETKPAPEIAVKKISPPRVTAAVSSSCSSSDEDDQVSCCKVARAEIHQVLAEFFFFFFFLLVFYSLTIELSKQVST